MMKINWLGSLAMTAWNMGFTSIFQWLRKDIWPWCVCDRASGSGREGLSEVIEPKPTLLTSCSSAASFTPYSHRRGQSRAYHPTHEGTHCLLGQATSALGSSSYEKPLDGVQLKSDSLQFQTAVNVSVLQGYREQC